MLKAGALGGSCRQLPVGHESLPHRKLVEKAQIEWLTDAAQTQAACLRDRQKEDGSGSAYKMAKIKNEEGCVAISDELQGLTGNHLCSDRHWPDWAIHGRPSNP